MIRAVCVATTVLAVHASAGAQESTEGKGSPAAEELRLADPQRFWSGWKGSVEAGLNGSSGNSESLNIRAGLRASRETERMKTGASLTYARASDDEEVTQNRFDAEARNDWLFTEESRWRYFLNGRYEYDDFQDWQHRVTLGNGVGYEFVDTERTELVGRVGVGLFREFGGEDNRVHPEGILGFDLAHQITERQRLTLTAEYLPDLLEFPAFKARAAGAWEVVIDPESNLSLKIGAEDRYDSTPGEGKSRNDLDYFMLLAVTF